MRAHNFSKYDPDQEKKSTFDKLLDAFMQLLTYTSGDVAEALSWLTELDKEYDLTNDYRDKKKKKQKKKKTWRIVHHHLHNINSQSKNLAEYKL